MVLGKLLLGLLAFTGVVSALSPPKTIADVDLTKYQGKWYQVADIPRPYELLCPDCVTATYTIHSNGSIAVLNQSKSRLQVLNSLCTVEGEATPSQSGLPGQYNIEFSSGFFASKSLPIQPRGTYWILGLGPVNDEGLYSWSVVSSEDRGNLYLLNRSPKPTDQSLQAAYAVAKEQGYDTSKIVPTVQDKC